MTPTSSQPAGVFALDLALPRIPALLGQLGCAKFCRVSLNASEFCKRTYKHPIFKVCVFEYVFVVHTIFLLGPSETKIVDSTLAANDGRWWRRSWYRPIDGVSLYTAGNYMHGLFPSHCFYGKLQRVTFPELVEDKICTALFLPGANCRSGAWTVRSRWNDSKCVVVLELDGAEMTRLYVE